MVNFIIETIFVVSAQAQFDPQLALAVAKTESQLNHQAIGPVGEIGLFQVRPEYSSLSTAQLKDIKLNVQEGIRKLKEAKRLCKHQQNNEWLVCYNVGVAGGNRIRYPHLFPYYKKVMSNYTNNIIAQN